MTVESSLQQVKQTRWRPVSGRLGRSLERWPLWGLGVVTVMLISGGGALFYLVTQPPKPNCSHVFWPLASASTRLYCAQELVRNPTLDNLLQAIALVDALATDHPLRGTINPRIEKWSTLALDRAEETFHQGNLKRAIEYARKIPTKTAAAKQVQARIARWQKIWAEGEEINDTVTAALAQEDWRRAFSAMVDWLYVENRYWSKVRYEEVSDIIIQAQKDEKLVVEAERLVKRGGFENLERALGLARQLPSETIFKRSRLKIFNGVADQFVAIAETALDQKRLREATDALSLIPRESNVWSYAQDLIKIANATSLTWAVSSDSYLRAMEELREIPKSSRLYGKAQQLIARWQGQIASVKVLEEAQTRAVGGDPEDLRAAIAQARLVASSSDKWEEAQSNIQDWRQQLELFEDQPILDYAEELSLAGDPASLRSAIAQVRKIGPGRLLYAEAQSRLRYWQSQLEDFSRPSRYASGSQESVSLALAPARQSSTDSSLEFENLESNRTLLVQARRVAQAGDSQSLLQAMNTANQVPINSVDRYEAELEIENWANQLLTLAVQEAPRDLRAAIALAQKVPPYSQVHSAAQAQIQTWQRSQPKPPSTGQP
ncbi:hypothetical protein [Lyngbya confervoides]|uniref:Chromosome segregation ATPase n=1 Tax=Lyngbya confervoides BDU141951 TaxID=1574623 RepID=A0ABD4SZY7_9CYAN|nr:hypothetical protein [Lyngbya confervoides]MCM1981763.1 hypothetical protein [Lyngbya confervoides BDU141951]